MCMYIHTYTKLRPGGGDVVFFNCTRLHSKPDPFIYVYIYMISIRVWVRVYFQIVHVAGRFEAGKTSPDAPMKRAPMDPGIPGASTGNSRDPR